MSPEVGGLVVAEGRWVGVWSSGQLWEDGSPELDEMVAAAGYFGLGVKERKTLVEGTLGFSVREMIFYFLNFDDMNFMKIVLVCHVG